MYNLLLVLEKKVKSSLSPLSLLLISLLLKIAYISLFVFFSPPLMADTSNNDTCVNSENITLPYPITGGSVGKDDKDDFYAFTLSSAGILTITTSNATRDIDAYLYNTCSTELVKDDAATNNPQITYTYTGSSSTTLQLQLHDYPNANGSSNYNLSINFTASNTPPIISLDTLSLTFDANISNGTTITDINATDADNDPIIYAIGSGNEDGAFDINSSTGIITVKDNTKFANNSLYTLTVTASDNKGGVDTIVVSVAVGLTVGWESLTYQASENTTLSYGASSTLSMNIVLNKPSLYDVNVSYLTYNGTATGDIDYRIAGGTVTIPANTTSKSVVMDIYHDEVIELAETFTVVLSNPTISVGNISIKQNASTATVTINEQTTAPLCYEDNFNTTSLDTSWRTLFSSGTFSPQIVDNRLRLTPNEGTKATAVTKDYEFPSLENIIIIEFTHYAYNGDGADGMALVLYNSTTGDTPTPGAFGGSLGYAQKCEDNTQYAPYNKKCSSDCKTPGGCPGFEGGWLGVGIDEYGNYKNPTEGRIGGTSATSHAVSIRGDGSGISGYEFLAGTNSLTPTLWNSGTTPSPGDKFRMSVDARDPAHLYVSLERDTGSGYNYIIQRFDAKDPSYNQSTTPELVRLAFTASTGASKAIHEIDNLKVWGRCTPYIPNPPEPPSNVGGIDVVDNYTNGYTYRQGLKTKIASQSLLTLDAVWLGTTGGTSPLPYYTAGNKDVVDMPVMFYMSEISGTTDTSACTTELYRLSGTNGEPLVATFRAGDTYARTSSTYTLQNQAKRYLKIVPKYINFYGMNLLDSSITCLLNSSNSGNIQGMPQCVNSANQYEQAFGSIALQQCRTTGVNGAPCDPNNHGIGTGDYAHNYGCYQCTLDAIANSKGCSSDAFAIRPKSFSSSLTLNKKFIAEHNETITFYAYNNNNIATPDYNETEYSSFNANLIISDSSKNCPTPLINFSPDINFTNGSVTSQYKLLNVGDFNLTIAEILGSEYAKIDSDDTIEQNRTISSYEIQLKVVPSKFDLQRNLSNYSNNFTYLYNFDGLPDKNMSAILDLNITAKGESNTTLSNYMKTCYAKDGNLTLNLKTPLAISPSNALELLLWFDESRGLEGNTSLHNSTNYLIPFSLLQFDSNDTNGTATVKYRLNFDRKSLIAANPILFDLNSTSFKDADDRNGSQSLDQNATFYYGRAHAPDYRFAGNSGTAMMYYEVYAKDLNLSQRQAFGITGNQGVDSVNWYQNALHVNTSGVTNPSSATINIGAQTNATTSSVDLTHTPPHVGKVNLGSSSWLVYYPTDFTVEFYSSGSWAGAGFVREGYPDTNDTNITVGEHIHKAAPIKANKRITW